MGLLSNLFGRQNSKTASVTTCKPRTRCFSANEQADRLAVIANIKDDMIDWLTSLPILNEGGIFVHSRHPEVRVCVGHYSDTMTFKCGERDYRLALATQVIDRTTRKFEVQPLFHTNTTYILNSSLEDVASDAVILKQMIEKYRSQKIVCTQLN